MIRLAMRGRIWAVLALGLAGAQGGHLVAYRLRFGAAALQIQSTGAHAYFPTAVKTALGAGALAILGALLVIGIARSMARGRRVCVAASTSFLAMLAALFTLQLAWFMGQELTEALIAGVPPGSAANLLLWGMVGQLPVAVAGAAILFWLGARFEAAVAQLGEVVRVTSPLPVTIALAPLALVAGERAQAIAHASRSRIVKRGPPSSTFRPF
jgi:hypothetical protein